jgi:MYXO-CTERM domain-containing protein
MTFMRTRLSTLALSLGAILSLPSTKAAAQDLFGRRGLYDSTGSEVARGYHVNLPYVRGESQELNGPTNLAGSPVTEVRRNFVYVQDADGMLTIPYQNVMDLYNSFDFALRQVYSVLPDEFKFVYLFTTFETGVGAFFYAPEANDVMGLGSGNPVMDTNGSSPREGFVFMNYWQSFPNEFQGAPPEFIQGQSRFVFNQEAAHRWCAYVTAGTGAMGAGADVMLGRDNAHWSYFLNSSGSPMEGNDWVDNGNGTFTTQTSYNNWHYSQLDLYLMGLQPSSSVMPFLVVSNPVIPMGMVDLFGNPLTKASPPQLAQVQPGPVTFMGQRANIDIASIIAQNGTRSPAYPNTPNKWRVVFLLLASKTGPVNESQKVQFEQMVDGYAAGFAEGTGMRGSLDYALNPQPKQPIGGTCMHMEDCDALQSTTCLVVPPVASGSGLCTRQCSSQSGCPQTGGWCCQPASSGVNVCLPQALCMPDMPDAGSADAASQTCFCDITTGCDPNCACDQDCASDSGTSSGDAGASASTDSGSSSSGGDCACDTTYGCDKDQNGAQCACDADCKATPMRHSGGCSGVSSSEESSPLFLAMVGLLLLFGRIGRSRRLANADRRRSDRA